MEYFISIPAYDLQSANKIVQTLLEASDGLMTYPFINFLGIALFDAHESLAAVDTKKL